MSKIIYAYFNDKDLHHLLGFLETRKFPIYAQNGTSLNNVKAISTGLVRLYIPICETRNIEITMCRYAGFFLQPGMVKLGGEPNQQEISVFNTIKKHICQGYKLSKDKTYYIGPGIYSDWLQGMHKLPVLFEYDEVIILEQDLEEIFTNICSKGFIIRANDIRLRAIDEWTFNDEAFIICDDISKLHKLIVRKTFVHYDYGSVCIFVYKDSKRKQYRFLMDKRIDVVAQHKLINLFEDIRKQYGQMKPIV